MAASPAGARRCIVLATVPATLLVAAAIAIGAPLMLGFPGSDLESPSTPSRDLAGVRVPADPDREPVTRRALREDGANALVLEGSGTVFMFGRVRTATGAPIRAESALLLGPDHESLSLRVHADGVYEVADVPRQVWRLLVHAPGFRPADRLLDLTRVAGVTRVDVSLEPCVTLGVTLLTTMDQPLRPSLAARRLGHLRLGVFATREVPHDLPLSVHTGLQLMYGNGRWREGSSGGYSDGTLEWDGPLPFHVSVYFNHLLLASRRVASGERDVELRVDVDRLASTLGSIRLTLLDAVHGTPLRRALVTVDGRRTVRVNDVGSAIVERVPPGIRAVRVNASTYETWSRYVRVAPGRRAELGAVRIWRRVRITGMVQYGGAPIQSKVTLIPMDASEHAALESGLLQGHCADGRTTTGGMFRFEQAGRRRYLLVAHRGQVGREMLWGTTIVDATLGAVCDVCVGLAPAHRVEMYLPRGLEQATLHIVDANRVVVWSRQWSRGAVEAWLCDGSYRLRVFDGTRWSVDQTFDVAGRSVRVVVSSRSPAPLRR